jgi:predicted NAD-dependent protein-ADP-ribosyltransferase YbiA (DUF1768 family)
MMIPNCDVFQFYSKSADKPPGLGVGEHVSDPLCYAELASIAHWRRMFSDLWEDDIVINGLTYRTHHHAFQAGKFQAAGLADIGYMFSKESGSTIGLGTGIDAFRARKKVILSPEQYQKWQEQKGQVKDAIYAAKFTRESHPGKALLATQNALIINKGPRIKRIECVRLMRQRENLKRE